MQTLKILVFILLSIFIGFHLGYILFPYEWRLVILALLCLGGIGVIFYADKILLALLRSREVIDTIEHSFFQRIKNVAFKLGTPSPRVFAYRGNVSRIFALQSRKDISLVFEAKILSKLSPEEQTALITYMLLTLRAGGAKRRTLVYAISSMLINSLYFLRDKLTTWMKINFVSNALVFLYALIVRPIVISLFSIAFTKKEKRKIKALLATHLTDSEMLNSAMTKISYRTFNEDLIENTLINFLNQKPSDGKIKRYVDIFEVFPVLEIDT
ncbi:MAG: hypothetical protein JNM93_03350 [Bacteriovoracaceae bacterium]|nr:hypothetical protein [Bacteriovoracaceae bacterium]